MSHNSSDRPHGWWLSLCSRQGDDMNYPIAREAQTLVRQAAGETSGLIVAAQIQKAAKALGYPATSWRIREAWYGRAGSFSAQAIADLQQRYFRWREQEQARAQAAGIRQAAADRALLQEIRRKHLAELAKIESRLAALGDRDTD